MRASSEPNERLPCPGSASFRAPNFHIARRAVRITGVRGRVPLEFYAVNVQNRHIGSRRQAHGAAQIRARCGVRSRAHVTLVMNYTPR